MSAQIPTPAALAQRFVAALGAQQFTASDGTTVTLDATAPATMESALAILSGLSDYEIYLYLRDQLLELMVTTATVTPGTGLLPQHAQIWGVPRTGALAAVGYFLLTASAAVTVPAGTAITVDGTVQWTTDSAVTISAGATVSVPATATTTDVTGNLAANTAATLVSPIVGISSVVSDQNGITGGAPVEGVESWRARIIDVIRNPPGAGTSQDYIRWAKLGGAVYVNPLKDWVGTGTVGVICAMAGGRVPTASELSQIAAAVKERQPLRANVFVVPVTVVPLDVTISLNPDTVTARNTITQSLPSYFLSAGIGGTIYREGIDDQIVAANGHNNDLIAPASDLVLQPNQIATLGNLTFAPGAP